MASFSVCEEELMEFMQHTARWCFGVCERAFRLVAWTAQAPSFTEEHRDWPFFVKLLAILMQEGEVLEPPVNKGMQDSGGGVFFSFYLCLDGQVWLRATGRCFP